MADRSGKGYVVEFQLINREPIQHKDALAEAELDLLAKDVERAIAALERINAPRVDDE